MGRRGADRGSVPCQAKWPSAPGTGAATPAVNHPNRGLHGPRGRGASPPKPGRRPDGVQHHSPALSVPGAQPGRPYARQQGPGRGRGPGDIHLGLEGDCQIPRWQPALVAAEDRRQRQPRRPARLDQETRRVPGRVAHKPLVSAGLAGRVPRGPRPAQRAERSDPAGYPIPVSGPSRRAGTGRRPGV